MNPLLEITFRVPFDKIQTEHVEPAIDELLADANERLEQTIASPHPLHALDTMTEKLEYAMNVIEHLQNVATTPQLRAAFQAVQPKVSAFRSGIHLNESLWQSLKRYADTEEARGLTGTMRRFLTLTMDDFKRAGADLDPAGKARLKEIDVELAAITTKFSQHVLDATNGWELVLTDESKLAGLPASAIAAARASAAEKGREGWRFTLQEPSLGPLMKYLDDASIREQAWRAQTSRATSGELDNRPLIVRILQLRKEKANLLGFRDFADLVLEDRMAHTGERAANFISDLRGKTEPRFREENQELAAFAGHALQPWDVGYWAEKQRVSLFRFDEEELRPYFPVESVVSGMFQNFGRAFGIRVVEEADVPVWDPCVHCYAIRDSASDRYLGSFYADWYPRENKRGGAWMEAMITGNPAKGEPHLGVICGNMTQPVGGKPALLTHREVETIFHEFGHLLHHVLSRVEVRSLSGTHVAWDFVELPSQIMENWCWERESLDMFARHYETGAPIPEELFAKMHHAKTFRGANAQMRQIGFASVDLALHREWDAAIDPDVMAYAQGILAQFAPVPLPANYGMIAGFTHLFADPVGYGAAYYSYKWAEVLDADAFTRFQREGVLSESAGRAFREKILERGNSEDPAVLYRDFMGRDPDPNALLERVGLPTGLLR